jgi:hypothetical protein
MFPFPGVVSQGVVSATALDPASSDTVLLCTDSGVVAEMHMESFTMGHSWDLGGLLGTRACEGMVWASDSQVRCASSVPDDARAPRAPLLIDAFCAHGVQGVLHVACMACRQTATTGPVSSQPFDLSTGSLWITDAKSVYDVRLTATSAVLRRKGDRRLEDGPCVWNLYQLNQGALSASIWAQPSCRFSSIPDADTLSRCSCWDPS